MPIGPFGEIIGTTGTLEGLSDGLQKYKSKVIAPRNPKLVKGQETEFKIKPSQYMFQMSLNTEQKLTNQHTMKIPVKTELLDMAEMSHQKACAVNVDEPMFQPFPSEIFFQNFNAFETYEVPLTLRNNDKVPRLVKVSQEDSPYFKIVAPHNVGHKVGPGLPTTFKIQFTPEEKRDYHHEVVCVTEREKFIVPVRAIGARAILDFPDEVNFQANPVKHSNNKTLLVRNVGNKEAKFTLETEKPFSVSPPNGILGVNESLQVTVEFKPSTVGDHQKDLVVRYDSGEDVYVHLYGAAQDSNVRLDKNSIRVENTYISMANQRTVTISNRSDVIVHYKWSQYATQEEEDQQKLLFCDSLNTEESAEHNRFLEECISDPTLRDKMSILSRTFQNRRKLVTDDAMVFNDDVFKFDPVEGEIWPNSIAEVSVLFKPTEAQSYTCTAFCDVTGRESRLPLRMQGVGVGPKVQFSFDRLDMGNIFVNSSHTYEVVIANKGYIDAIFSLLPASTPFGPRFSFNPCEGIVMPEGHQAVQVTFNSPALGDFDETFEFQVDGAPDTLKLNFCGSVIGPTFHFDVPKLKFGPVSYGFTSTQTCALTNTALVPMSFRMRALGDGQTDSISSTSEYDGFSDHGSGAGSGGSPKEFEIIPSHGTIPPQSEIKVTVKLTSNTVKKYDVSLVVDVDGVGAEVLALPMSAKCIVPNIGVLTPILDYGRCFLRHPYEHNVKLHNDTDLPAKYELVPQHVDEMTPILFTSPQPRGIIEPHSILDVPLVITPQGLEELEILAQLMIFGSPEPPLSVLLTCIGEGPVVHVMPLDLDWRETPVLTDTPKIIRLSNESLIPARFTAHMVRPGSVWRVEPPTGEIPPEDQVELTVTACLNDAIRFQDKVQINIVNGASRSVPVSAVGGGTTVVTDPPMLPALNLGPHFSKGALVRRFTLTNNGRRHQSLVWGTEGFSFIQKPKRGGLLKPLNTKDMKFRDSPPEPEPPKPVFTLTPPRMELAPGDSCEVELRGCVDMPRVVKERLLCHAIIGKAGGKELIMRVPLNCEFISPLLDFSEETLNFRVDKQPDVDLPTEEQELIVTNVSSLPLTAQISLPHPFSLILEGRDFPCAETEIRLGIGEIVKLLVQFDAAYRDDHHIRVVDESLRIAYKEHPHVDEVKLKGQVYFPNLEFEKKEVNFGCILNDTEVTRYVNITNNSPHEVKYKWSFLLEEGVPVTTFHRQPSPPPQEEMVAQEDIPAVEEDPMETAPFEEEGTEQNNVQVTIEGAESPRADDQGEEELTKEQLILGEQPDGEEKKDQEKAVPSDGEPPAVQGDAQIENLALDENLDDHMSGVESRPVSQLGTARAPVVINPILAQLIEEDKKNPETIDVSEVFDILPLYGTLASGETEQITFTFFGHQDTCSAARAVCEVQGGPQYEVHLRGEASLVQYRFDCLDVDYGKQMYDQIGCAEIVLMNTGMVGFEFTALGMDPQMSSKPQPGVPVMIPHTGFIEANSQQVLTVKYLAGVPEKFHKSFRIQVAHFEPDEIHLSGEGVFPRISLDLPRALDAEGQYERLLAQARAQIQEERRETERPSSAVSGKRMDAQIEECESEPSELEVQMEAERLVVAEFTGAEYRREAAQPDILTVHPPEVQPPAEREGKGKGKARRKPTKPKARLPTYLLDFGHVVLGTVRTHVVRATNTGWFPVSFSVERDHQLQRHGFTVELDRIKQLPGAPDHETVDFVVSFDPRGGNLGLGEVDVFIPINIVNGPQVVIEAKAHVTMPDMQISSDVLEFSDVKCGECKVITIQLHNHQQVRCEWSAVPTERDKKKVDRHVPMHLRRKTRVEKQKSPTFEMMPPAGYLLPGQRTNVQVKFMPTEHKFYEQRLVVRLAQSSERLSVLCRGQGLEPHVELERNLVEFGPILPHSPGDEQALTLRNPCPFPVEIYNLEFDKSYLEEEKILRLMKGYDEYSTVLLPPRDPGTKLPSELTDYYEEQMKKLEEQERVRREEQEAAEQRAREQAVAEGGSVKDGSETSPRDVTGEGVTPAGPPSVVLPPSRPQSTDTGAPTTDRPSGAEFGGEGAPGAGRPAGPREEEERGSEHHDGVDVKDSSSSLGVGELDVTPVSAAIARHLGIDLSPEGKAARNRRGIVCIVHGAPMSGKTTTAVALAKRYEAALLTVDGVVMEAITNGNTPAGLRARELCAEAAQRRAEELRAQEGEEGAALEGVAPGAGGAGGKKGGLSVEAVTAHTQGSGQVAVAHSVAQSMVSKKTSTISELRTKGHGAKGGAAVSSGDGTSQFEGNPPLMRVRSSAFRRLPKGVAAPMNRLPRVPGSPTPLAAPISRKLSISASVGGEQGLMSTVLPEEILVDILNERLMLNDCQRGVVFDGLETLFSQNLVTTCTAVLKAVNNRKYIYFVWLKLDYGAMKEQEKKAQEEKECADREREEAERRHLEEMSEDEYDALSEEAKAEVDRKRLAVKKERLRREQEERRRERERREREEAEAELRRLEEEKTSKRKRKGADDKTAANKDGKKSQAAPPKDSKSSERVGGGATQPKSQEGKKQGHGADSEHAVGKTASTAGGADRPDSHTRDSDRGESAAATAEQDSKKRKDKSSKDGKRPVSNEKGKGSDGPGEGLEEPKEMMKESEILLLQRFKTFEHSTKEIFEMVDCWERTTGLLRPMTPAGGADLLEEQLNQHPPSGKKGKKGMDKKSDAKTRAEQLREQEAIKAANEKLAAAAAAGGEDGEEGEGCPGLTEEERREKRLEDGIGLPHCVVDCATEKQPTKVVLEWVKLPGVEEVLDGLGLGPRGPPIPPPAHFAVVPYPVKRHTPPGADSGHYVFIASSPDDPNILVDEKQAEPEPEEEKSTTPDGREKDHTPTGKSSRKSDKGGKGEREGRGGRKSSARSKAGGGGTSVGGRRSSMAQSPPPGAQTPASETDNRLGTFRWVIPAQGEVTLRLRFISEDLGQFDQTLNFEIMGTRRRYQLYCRGVCAFPNISREPRIVFPHRKKSKKGDEIVHKKYVLGAETYEFGPLLVGKSRDKYKEGKYPENMEKLTVQNTSPLEADISFCFQHDSKAETFLLEPPAMVLKPGQQEELSIWAYPKTAKLYEDALVCCIKENPEPVIFKVTCHGVRPELEPDKKHLFFDKVLLHRKDTKSLYLRNPTMLPVLWRLSGLESLGDDFSVSQESGVIEPRQEFPLHAYFRAMKPVTTNKKSIRLEVYDVDNIMGLVQSENIQVHAEAYDVALDMSFPRGADGGIDFDVIRVLDEQKQQCSLKNKGKYEVAYSFVFEPSDECGRDVCDMFTVTPQKGTLSPVDRPAQVQVSFRSTREVNVKDQPILKCQVIEPNIVEGGEVIAMIPIKISVRSVFSKYNILPVNDINFGALLLNSRKQRTFTLENKGDKFEYKYSITKMINAEAAQAAPAGGRKGHGTNKRSRSRDGSSSGRSVRPPPLRYADSARQDMPMGGGGGGGAGANQSRLVLGMFTVYPAFGYILPGAQQTITVDCTAETPGRCEEEIAIDITGRDPKDHPGGIPYRLVAEACQQAINVSDIGTIFEEHRIVKNLSVWQHTHQIESGGVFGEDENRFVFNNVLVGMRAKARFKISNSNKVPCDVVFALKPIAVRGAAKHTDVFEVEPSRAQIPSHSHMYATVTFCPPSMQSFTAQFETALDGVPPNQAKGRNLLFEVHGEGNLPRINILKPSVRNKKGQPLVLFKKTLIGRTHTLPFVIANEGSLPSKVDIDLADPDSCFTITPVGGTQAVMAPPVDAAHDAAHADGRKRPHAASVIINTGEQAVFNARFSPSAAQRSQASLRLTVINNQYEDSVVQMVGEGYEDDITLDNIHSVVRAVDPEQEEGSMADDDVSAAKPNLINFGDCTVSEPRTLTFSLTNHSSTDSVRFVWPGDHPELRFSPAVGHLHPGRSKDLAVTFRSEAPKSLVEQEVPCRVTRITYGGGAPPGEWDDRLRTVRWVDVAPQPVEAASSDSGNKPGSPSAAAQATQDQHPAQQHPARSAKKKVIETEPEPAFTETPDSSRTIELLVSAICDHCKYKCKTESIHFRDTLMFQTRVFEFQLSNKGNVAMDYNWQLLMENYSSPGQRSVTFARVDGAGAASEEENSRPTTAATAALAVRPGSALDYRPDTPTSSIISDVAYTPYTIEPESGAIQPGKKATFKVKFSPLDVQECDARLVCSIPNLEPGKQGPTVLVKGKSLMPYCHFELVDSDYITGARRNPELRGPGGAPPGTTLDPNTRVIEFDAVGVGVKTVRRFGVVNPTTMRYTYLWENNDEANPKKLPDFRLAQNDGEIRPGKKAEILFEFTSSQLGIVESFMTFHLTEHNISVPFLLVGNTRDCNVSMDRSHLNYKSLLIGHEAMETVHIQNSEDASFAFAFDQSSCHSPGFSNSLRVEPMHGVVPSRGSVPINIYFTPNSEKEVNFNLVCEVRRKTLPLTLNIKAEGYSMNCLVLCEDLSGNKVELTSSGLNAINFGEVEVNEKSTRNLYIVNSGKFNFDYTWELTERSSRRMVAINPAAGGVMCEQRACCKLSFCPPSRTTLRGCDLILKISNGPRYEISVLGEGVVPGVTFSFSRYDFGPCFIHRAGMPTHSAVLHVTNKDRKEVSVECLYTPNKHLHHNFEAKVIPPGQTEDVTFTFYPRDAIKYKEVIQFEINGLSKQTVEIFGLGTEMKIEVANPRDKIVKFGAMRVGQTVKRTVPIINNSPAPITFHLGVTPSSAQLQDRATLRLTPTHDITLQPRGGTAKVDIVFSPKCRIPNFTEEVMLECAGLFQPLFVVSGSCQGIEISLDSEALPFGAVVQKSSSVRKLIMLNTGDIGARFKWEGRRFEPDFSIHPTEGYISPGMEVPFEVTFRPQEISQDIRYENLNCAIEGSKPLQLTLTGMCIAVAPGREVINFSTSVRHAEKKKVMVPNKTNAHWNLRPVIDGEFWTGPETFTVEPQQIKGYELKYKPLTMTTEGKKHTGTVFFPMPDGNGLLYNLTGTAEAPKPVDKVQTKDIPCKTSYTHLLPVENWLKKPQRFKVRQEIIRPEKLDAGTTVKGLDYIDVPGNSKRDYKLGFYAHREGITHLKIIFTNETTGEYQFYEITFKAVRPGVISSITLTTPVRQSVPHTLMLENPLHYPVTFAASCQSVPEIMMPNQMSVPAQSEGAFNLEYLPLKVGDVQGRLEFNCNDLGLYLYDLELKATKAGPERALYFRTCLGTSAAQSAKFLNFAKQRTDYSLKVDNPDFHVDKTLTAAPGSNTGTEVSVDVHFEPGRIGESRGTLTVSSGAGGDYTFPLFGTCVAPKPQGPFVVKAGSTTNISFRNVFSHSTPFTFKVDNPLFHVAKQGETVRSRKDHRIVVGFDGNDSPSSRAAVMGKLVVSCAKSAGGATNAQWVYYLKGVTPEGR